MSALNDNSCFTNEPEEQNMNFVVKICSNMDLVLTMNRKLPIMSRGDLTSEVKNISICWFSFFFYRNKWPSCCTVREDCGCWRVTGVACRRWKAKVWINPQLEAFGRWRMAASSHVADWLVFLGNRTTNLPLIWWCYLIPPVTALSYVLLEPTPTVNIQTGSNVMP